MCGSTDVGVNSEPRSFHIYECSSDSNLHKTPKQIFSNERFVVKKPETDPDSRTKILLESTPEKPENRFDTGPVWKYNKVNLPNSLPMYTRRLECLRNKIPKDTKFSEEIHPKTSE